MAGIATSVQITDRVSGSLNRITAALYNTTSAFGAVDRASETTFNAPEVQVMANEMFGYSERVQQLESDLIDANNRLKQMEEQTEKATAAGDKLRNMFSLVKSALTGMAVKKIVDISDNLVQTTARLNMMNDGVQTTQELINKVYQSAQSARGSFSDMADVVAKLGNNAGAAFGNNTAQIVEFATLVQKQMTIAGATTTEASNAMMQLTQALGSGTLRGDELNSIFEQAPNIIQTIANYLDVPIGKIREMASEGQLSADIVKNAMFSASDEINSKFNEMPMTWGQIWQSVQNTALIKFQPILNKINELANSGTLDIFIGYLTGAMVTISNAIMGVIEAISFVGTFFASNWGIIGPIVYGVVAALMAYGAILGVIKVIEFASAAATIASNIAKGIQAVVTWATTAATWAQVKAQMGLNAAMYANPIVWVIGIIIALIAIIYVVVGAINKFANKSISATGIIAGAFAVLGAFIYNRVIVPLWNNISTFINFFGNVFNDPIASIKILFYDLALNVIGYVSQMASAIETVINKIPGVEVDITSGLDNFKNDLEAAQQEIKDESGWVEYAKTLEYKDYGEAASAGYAFGESAEEKISSTLDSFNLTDGLNMTEGLDSAYTDTGAGTVADYTSDIADNTGNISNSVDISNENLKYLRDIAERDTINRFTTAEIKVDMNNNNTITNTNDLDGIISTLTQGVQEALLTTAEGVHK